MDDSNEKIVLLNQDIGYLLMKHLNGLDVVNFMEAVNGSEQFSTIEITKEQIFLALFTKFMSKEKIKVVVSYLHCYLDTCSVDDEGYLCPDRYYQGAPPVLRLFVHPSFTVEAFEHLCSTYKTPSFQCYSRLLPLNTYTYVGNLILIDYFKYKDIIGCMRELNEHEQSLFKGMNVRRADCWRKNGQSIRLVDEKRISV